MTLDRKSASLSDEAMEWLVLVREHPDDPEIRTAFEHWVQETPEHRREWERTCRMWQALAEVPASRRPAATVPGARLHRRGAMSLAVRGAVAAGVLLCLGTLAAPALLIRFQADFQTETAEARNITLDDGSIVHLAPDSALALAFSDGRRGVTLLKGEAFFEVAHDANRPFTVESGGLKVEVLGTAFDVRLGGGEVEVALAHGSVKATAEKSARGEERILAPGDFVTLDRATGELVASTVAVADIGSWRDGRLYVVDQTIGTVIEQIQRYHPALISIPDPALARQRVSGIYDLTSPDKALGALVDPYGGKVRKIANHLRIVSRL